MNRVRTVLAMELSSARGSVALLRGDEIVCSAAWTQEQRDEGRLFESVRSALAASGVPVKLLDAVVAGRGPGSYTGIRMAMTAAHFLAAPHGRSAYFVGSAEAVALEACEETGVERVTVIGDARRGAAWLGRFRRGDDGLVSLVGGWTLLPLEEVRRAVAEEPVVISPDWPRLRERLGTRVQDIDVRRVRHRYPSAEWVGRTALLRMSGGAVSDPREPLYLHPPVVAPSGADQ